MGKESASPQKRKLEDVQSPSAVRPNNVLVYISPVFQPVYVVKLHSTLPLAEPQPQAQP